MQSLDYYPLLFFQVGTNDVATGSLRSIKKDFRAALERRLKEHAINSHSQHGFMK